MIASVSFKTDYIKAFKYKDTAKSFGEPATALVKGFDRIEAVSYIINLILGIKKSEENKNKIRRIIREKLPRHLKSFYIIVPELKKYNITYQDSDKIVIERMSSDEYPKTQHIHEGFPIEYTDRVKGALVDYGSCWYKFLSPSNVKEDVKEAG